ncbi:unnamed protein product [Prunus armeniaca]|uniref:Uncharacterized protein n=1 Tax=Prunus armeniaca TaxID=36596 RepID=A0A6J5UGM4_PRUAR|nr:unnamed protein product [Prunus armeniaca]
MLRVCGHHHERLLNYRICPPFVLTVCTTYTRPSAGPTKAPMCKNSGTERRAFWTHMSEVRNMELITGALSEKTSLPSICFTAGVP